MATLIDQELLIEILKRLPAKVLIQFRCVSKSWYSLITNPSFISIHSKFTNSISTSATKSLLRHYSWVHKQEKYTIHGTSFEHYQELVFPFKSHSQYFEIVGSCNGLLCLSDTYRLNSHTIILWNPTIRKSLTLPLPCITFDQIYVFVLGFGFDFKTNEHKVIRVVYFMSNNGCRVDVRPQVEVYVLGKNSWRSINITAAPKYVISELSMQVFFNGAVHWIGYNPSGNFRDLSIVSFSMSSEVFAEMLLPDSVSGLSVLDLTIFSSNKMLALIQYNLHTPTQWIQYGSCSIWMMKDYGNVGSWCKQFTIDLQGGVGKALHLCDDKEMLLVASNGELESYDIQSKQSTHLGIKGIVKSFHMVDYVETLILLDRNSLDTAIHRTMLKG